MTFQPRDYQTELSDKGYKILNTLNILALIMEVRTGKTITALLTCQKAKCNHVLFITKKKVIESNTILNDYELVNPSFKLTQINYESVHKLKDKDYDIIIIDESHSLGAYPKPSLRTKRIKKVVGNKRVILLSGTITPESYSQIYHQFWVSNFSPFTESSFYKWANSGYVTVKKKYVAHGNQVNDYSNANEKLINQKTSKYILTYSQQDAGFKSKVNEHILYVEMKPLTYQLVNKLENDLVIQGKKGGVILADTGVKLMQKVHQLYSGTVKLEDGSAIITDDSKAKFIKDYFKGQKIAIFYKFKEELELLKRVFKNYLTTSLEEFNNSSKNIALQIFSGREGISLKNADSLVMYNIDFSSTSYWQSRDRMTTKNRSVNNVYWVFSKGGLEDKVYKTVLEKKSYTLSYYERSKVSKQVNQVA